MSESLDALGCIFHGGELQCCPAGPAWRAPCNPLRLDARRARHPSLQRSSISSSSGHRWLNSCFHVSENDVVSGLEFCVCEGFWKPEVSPGPPSSGPPSSGPASSGPPSSGPGMEVLAPVDGRPSTAGCGGNLHFGASDEDVLQGSSSCFSQQRRLDGQDIMDSLAQ